MSVARVPKPKMMPRVCACCGKSFEARAVDVRRGWGRFCSKRCKAIKQEARTHQHRDHMDLVESAIRSGRPLVERDEYDDLNWASTHGQDIGEGA